VAEKESAEEEGRGLAVMSLAREPGLVEDRVMRLVVARSAKRRKTFTAEQFG